MKKFIALALLACTAAVASAQQLKVATGDPKGTYHALFVDVMATCNQNPLIEQNTSGSLENIDLLTNKNVSAAFVQTDALFASAQGRDLGHVKTLLALHRESVHVLAKAQSGLKIGGIGGFGGKDVVFNAVTDLNGYKVAAAGGSLITAQYIKLMGQVKWEVVPVKDNDEAMKALNTDQVQAVLMVGGQPLGNVRDLGPQYRLVGFAPPTIELLKTAYVKDTLSYPKMAVSAIPTVSTEALLVTRTVTTPDRIKALKDLRACVYRNIATWQDSDGTHPAWAQIDSKNRGKWSYYELK